MTQAKPPTVSAADRPITWRDAAVYAHGALVTECMHMQMGWPIVTATAVGLTGPVLWALLRRV